MKTVYISGPITDKESGQPRKGWQKDFLDAEARLRRMGFNVINPVDIAKETEDEWRQMWTLQGEAAKWNGPIADAMAKQGPTRATYITACLQTMNTEALAGRLDGLYVVGEFGPEETVRGVLNPASKLLKSHGVHMEILLARVLGIPVFAEYCQGAEIGGPGLYPVENGLKIYPDGEFGHEDWSDRLKKEG